MKTKPWQGAKGEGYVVIQFLLLALLLFGPRHLPTGLAWPQIVERLGQVFAYLLFVPAGLLLLLGLVQLGKNLSVLPHPKKDAVLIETGIFAWVRHPVYGGIILLSLAWACLEASSLMLVYSILLFVFFEFKSKREEKALEQSFQEYSRYKARVKKFIPFIY